jgi:hypothetical protein
MGRGGEVVVVHGHGPSPRFTCQSRR